MPKRKADMVVSFTPQQMYDLVVDMDRYPEFLPWCAKARKYDVEEMSFKSEITFSFKSLRETFHTVDKVEPGRKITISHLDGPFRYLESQWLFVPVFGGTKIDFFIDFNFKNPVLNLTLGPLFAEASRRMVEAFKKRAESVYTG